MTRRLRARVRLDDRVRTFMVRVRELTFMVSSGDQAAPSLLRRPDPSKHRHHRGLCWLTCAKKNRGGVDSDHYRYTLTHYMALPECRLSCTQVRINVTGISLICSPKRRL